MSFSRFVQLVKTRRAVDRTDCPQPGQYGTRKKKYPVCLTKLSHVCYVTNPCNSRNLEIPVEIILRRLRTLPDGRTETYTPMRNADGYYILADRAVDPQHNKAVNQFFVKDIAAVAARLRAGGVSLRMKGDITGQPNLISASEVEILEPDEDDPFETFSEWASEADDKAFQNL